jgi:acetyltransferase-like isoleucine patch superfamily enzyme
VKKREFPRDFHEQVRGNISSEHGEREGEAPTALPGEGATRAPNGPFLSIADDVKLGRGVKLSKFINLYGCSVDENTKIGAFVEVQKNATIGKNCKISSHTFICEGVTIEDDVFVGHSVVFINDTYPRATADGSLQTEADWTVEPTLVKRGASIGSNCTVLSNVTIGERAIVGAGSVVTKDVPADTIVAGNPARFIRKLEEKKVVKKAVTG